MKRNKSCKVKVNERGLTLVELLVAMTVLLFVSLAMMQTALVGIDSNMRNVMRDEAVGLAGSRLDLLRAISNKVGLNNTTQVVSRDIRSATVDYTVYNTVNYAGADAFDVEVMVEWLWKGENYNTTVKTIMR